MYQRVSQLGSTVRCTVYPQPNLTGWYQYRYLNTQVMNFSTGLGSIWNPYAIFFLKKHTGTGRTIQLYEYMYMYRY